MERLGKNQGRYHGETIDIDQVQHEIHRLAITAGWTCDEFLNLPEITLRAYRRPVVGAQKNLYISAGIHGDEPSGPLAVLQLVAEDQWPLVNLWLVPLLNPTGFRLNTRENAAGIDLNRNYRHITAPEVRAHTQWLASQPEFDLTLLLHEDWEANGFYVYELNPESRPTFAEPMIDAVRSLCPIETAELVDNFVCRAGVIRPAFNPQERPQWAEAIYLAINKSHQSYTLETPSDYPLPFRVQAHVAAVREVLRRISG